MKNKIMLLALSSWVFNLAAFATDEENKKDPKTAELSYFATVKTEIAPEFGQVTFSYHVNCQPTAAAATQAIATLSSKVWNTIVTKTGKNGSFTATERSIWNPINTVESPGNTISYSQPQFDNKGVLVKKGMTINKNNCTGKEIGIAEKVANTFSASQKIGIRTSKLDWLEGLVKAARSEKQENKVDSVRATVSDISYLLTEETKTKTYNALLAQAQERATGKGSQFETDRKNLKFASAHFIGARAARAPSYRPTIGSPIARGTASKVELRVPFTYKIYAESADRIDPKKNTKSEQVNNSYEIEGVADTNADYAILTVELSSGCHETAADALKALSKTDSEIAKLVSDFNNRQNTETNALNFNAVGTYETSPSIPLEWNNDVRNLKYTLAFDPCTGNKIAVKEDQKTPVYHVAHQTYQLRTSNFEGALNLKEKLVKDYYTTSNDTKKVVVGVSEVEPQVTKATQDALTASARAHATACILDPNGPVAKDAALHGFSCAHLTELRMGRDRMQNMPFDSSDRSAGFAPGKAMKESAGGAPQEDTLDVTFVKKDNEQRVKAPIEKTFEFRYRVLTENYVPKKSK